MSKRVAAQPQKTVKSAGRSAPSAILRRKCACGGGGSAGLTGECAECDSKALTLQRRARSDDALGEVPPVVHDVLDSPGQPLDASTRRLMESRMGHDFSRVRVHADGKAAESAKAVNALAYTVKHHITFDAGRYSPDTRDGQSLLAHELAHVVQQSRGGSAPLSLSQDRHLEQAADRAASAVVQGDGPVHVPGSSAPAIARQGHDGEAKEENIATPGEVKVIPDKAAGKLRVVFVGPSGKILAGLAEITPPRGAALNPASVQVYAQWSGSATYPQVRIQTPKEWGSTINLRQDVAVQRGVSEVDEFHVTDVTKAEIEQTRQELIQWTMEASSKFYDLATTMAASYQRATPAEIKQAANLAEFQQWKLRRENAARVKAENTAYQEQMGMEGFTAAEAREVTEHYQGRSLRTPWEKEMYAKGNLQLMEEIRHPRTGVVIAYRERKLQGVGKEFYGTEEYVFDIAGNPLSSSDLASKAVYGPQDYILDPLGIQELAGVAESDTELSIISDIATGGAKLALKGGVKGVKGLAKLGRKGAAEGVETLARAGEREVAHEGVEGLSKIVKSEEVADAVAHQAMKSEGAEGLARGAGRSESAAAGAAATEARAEARAVASEVRNVDAAGSALAKEGEQGVASAVERDVAKAETPGKKVVAEHSANGHEYKVFEDGTVGRCSNHCGKLRKRIEGLSNAPAKERARMKSLNKKLDDIEAIADPKLKAQKAAEFDKQLTARHGPGAWMEDFAVENMSKDAAAYQKRITGAKTGTGYYLNNVQFDGFEPGKLIDAKFYTNDGRFMRDRWYQFGKAWDLLDDARRQVKAAGGMPIEWRVAGAGPAGLIQQLFKTHGIPITVVHVP